LKPAVTMEERSQGATEYMLLLGAALIIVAGITYMVLNVFSTLGSSVEGRIENTRKEVIDGLVGLLKVLK
jgi:uncharacterized protein (UPF0333 family)